MKLYHGTDHKIDKPIYQYKSETTDYGFGFYLTEDIELAKEWATNSKGNTKSSIVNIYELNTNNLKILDLTNNGCSPLHWIALLVKNRNIRDSSSMIKQAKEFLLNNYLLDLDSVDVVVGYRADDSYFAFVKSFLRNELNIDELETAIKLGDLGKQVFVKSKKAFDQLTYLSSEVVDFTTYSQKREHRENKALHKYRLMISSHSSNSNTIKDIMDGNK